MSWFQLKKIQAIKRVGNWENLFTVAASYCVTSNTVSEWHQNKTKFQKFFTENDLSVADRKSIKILQTPKINEAVYLWFYLLKNRGVLTSGPIIKEKTEFFSRKFPDENKGFISGEDWLHRWKTFYNIYQLNMNCEKLFSYEVKVMLYCDKLADTIFDNCYYKNQIFNTEETSLKYKIFPSKTSAVKADGKILGAKKGKGYVTVLTYANASESFRLPLLVIGKSAKPRALKNYDFRLSPVVYKSQKSAWMDGCSTFSRLVFEEFVSRVKKFVWKSGLPEKAPLLVYTPSHPATTLLQCEGIIKFLPPKTTSILQPMDQRGNCILQIILSKKSSSRNFAWLWQ